MLSFPHTLSTMFLQVLLMALLAVPAIWFNDNLKRRRARSLPIDRDSLERFG